MKSFEMSCVLWIWHSFGLSVGLAECTCAVTVCQALEGSADKNGKVGTVPSCTRGVVWVLAHAPVCISNSSLVQLAGCEGDRSARQIRDQTGRQWQAASGQARQLAAAASSRYLDYLASPCMFCIPCSDPSPLLCHIFQGQQY